MGLEIPRDYCIIQGDKSMLAINMDDVMNVLNNCRPYLIGFGVVLLLAVAVIIAVRKMELKKENLYGRRVGSRYCWR